MKIRSLHLAGRKNLLKHSLVGKMGRRRTKMRYLLFSLSKPLQNHF